MDRSGRDGSGTCAYELSATIANSAEIATAAVVRNASKQRERGGVIFRVTPRSSLVQSFQSVSLVAIICDGNVLIARFKRGAAHLMFPNSVMVQPTQTQTLAQRSR